MPHFWKTASLLGAKVFGHCLGRLSPGEIEDIASHYMKALNARRIEPVATFAQQILRPSSGSIYDPDVNGENALLRRTAAFGFRTIFDVGANEGGWAKSARRWHPHATIHCFEIVPSTFETMNRNLRDEAGYVLNAHGLLDANAQVEVYLGNQSYISSTQKFQGSAAERVVTGQVRCGDWYTMQHRIDSIDLLKIDVEGAEGRVLRGFSANFADRRVRLVQFEYNRGAIESRFLLLDFYEFFKSKGYVVGKLTKGGVLFRDYHYNHEDFSGPNYVACRADDLSLRDAIAA